MKVKIGTQKYVVINSPWPKKLPSGKCVIVDDKPPISSRATVVHLLPPVDLEISKKKIVKDSDLGFRVNKKFTKFDSHKNKL